MVIASSPSTSSASHENGPVREARPLLFKGRSLGAALILCRFASSTPAEPTQSCEAVALQGAFARGRPHPMPFRVVYACSANPIPLSRWRKGEGCGEWDWGNEGIVRQQYQSTNVTTSLLNTDVE